MHLSKLVPTTMLKLLLLLILASACVCLCYEDIVDHKNFDLLPTPENCGDSNDDRIIGGTKTSLGQYPWMSVIGHSMKNCPDAKIEFRCGGTLITTKHVVTAAHCLVQLDSHTCESTGEFEEYVPYVVRLGEFDLNHNPDCDKDRCAAAVQDIKVGSFVSHEDYGNPKLRHDIGIIKLKHPAIYSRWVGPICMLFGENMNKNFVNMTGVVAGWGIKDIKTKQRSSQLLQLKIPIVDFNNCMEPFKRSAVIDSVHQICAGGEKNRDSCSGDSGGPLSIIADTEEGPRYHLLGVTSFGYAKCATKPYPAIYTNIPYYSKWILDHL